MKKKKTTWKYKKNKERQKDKKKRKEYIKIWIMAGSITLYNNKENLLIK
jgi:hypothetical protein